MEKEKPLDTMCKDCEHLKKECYGSYSGFYSGCVWKTATAEDMKEFSESMDKAIEEAKP